jgi:HK97 family phage major capsid protein
VSANVSPASITNGIVALTHTGTDADAVRTDVKTALGAFITANANPTNLVWIMPNSLALALTLMRNALGQREFPDITMKGGMFEGFPVIASQYCATVQGSPTSNIVVLVNAAEIFLADDGGVSVDMSNQATIEMSDDPENDTGTQVNMFQTNQIALRAERYINWARGRASSVVWFDDVAWAPPTS